MVFVQVIINKRKAFGKVGNEDLLKGLKVTIKLCIWTRFTTISKLSRKHYVYPANMWKIGHLIIDDWHFVQFWLSQRGAWGFSRGHPEGQSTHMFSNKEKRGNFLEENRFSKLKI